MYSTYNRRLFSNIDKLKGGCINNNKTAVFKLTLFLHSQTILGIRIKISLKRHGEAKTHFSKEILSDL